MEIKIVATTGKAQGQAVDVKAAKFFVGRHANCQLRPDIPDLAGIHALIEQRELRTYLRDFGAEGGTGINDRVLHARESEVFDGDLIQIGPMVLTLSIKLKGDGPHGLPRAPDGWPFLTGDAPAAGPATPAARPVATPPPAAPAKVMPPAAASTPPSPSHPGPAPPATTPARPLPPLARPAGAIPARRGALSCRKVDDVLVVTLVSPNLSEEETVSPVRYELRSLLEADDVPCRTVIDLGNTRYLSSRAVGVILAHYQGLERKGATMRVCRVSPEIKPVLDQMRLSMLIDIFPTVEEAVETSWE